VALDPILGGADNIEGPVGVAPLTVAAERGLDGLAENRALLNTGRVALRKEGWKVSNNALARTAKFFGKIAIVAHVAFAAADGAQAYDACMAN
jgi:hypothetical protein